MLDETTPMRPSSRKGVLRVEIEQRMREAAERGVRTIVVRALKEVNVLLVDGDPGAEPRDSEVFFLEHALTPQRRLRIFALRINWSRFHRPTLMNRLKGINISGGKRDDAGITITFSNQTGQIRVHRPSQMGRTGGSKFASCHENDILNVGKFGQRSRLEQIVGDGFDILGRK